MEFNQFQLEKLADYCFDISKGSLLAGLGFSITLPQEGISRLIFFISAGFFSLLFLNFGLQFGRRLK